MNMTDKLRGRMGEALCAEHLRKKGYELLASGYRSRFGEIDLIAKKRGVVAFVEVKLRRDDRFAAAMEQVGPQKQERIRKTALAWIAQNGDALQPRFDVCEVYLPEDGDARAAKINYLEDAF